MASSDTESGGTAQSSSEEEFQPKKTGRILSSRANGDDDASEVASEGSSGASEVYVVERVVKHKKRKDGRFMYYLKWLNYPESENTWENEEDVFCDELVQKYWNQKKEKTSSRRQSRGTPTPLERKKRKVESDESVEDLDNRGSGSEVVNKLMEKDSWEDDVRDIHGVEKKLDGQLTVYLTWKSGEHTVHLADDVRYRCPQKLIDYYQSNLRFKASS